jgi:hypothetical protein
MAVEGTAKDDFVARIPWLQPLVEAQRGLPVAPHDYTRSKVNAGNHVYLDADREIFRLTDKDGFILAWHHLTLIKINPDISYSVDWRDGTLDNHPSISVARDTREDSYELYLENVEGKEGLFTEFVRLLREPAINPSGISLEDGPHYSANHDLEFELFFGNDGSEPRMEVPEDAEGVQPNIPNKFTVMVHPDTEVFDSRRKVSHRPAMDSYLAEVFSWDIKTGEVYLISFDREFYINEADFIKYVNSGKMQIVKVIEDRMSYY